MGSHCSGEPLNANFVPRTNFHVVPQAFRTIKQRRRNAPKSLRRLYIVCCHYLMERRKREPTEAPSILLLSSERAGDSSS
jgi:hypothetical protein